MTLVKTFDPRCYELAEIFLADEAGLNTDKAKWSLALNIQQVIEDEIQFMHEGIFDRNAEEKFCRTCSAVHDDERNGAD